MVDNTEYEYNYYPNNDIIFDQDHPLRHILLEHFYDPKYDMVVPTWGITVERPVGDTISKTVSYEGLHLIPRNNSFTENYLEFQRIAEEIGESVIPRVRYIQNKNLISNYKE